MDRLDEALTIAQAMFTEERPSFQGTLLLDRPRPERAHADPAGRTAILIGGGGEQRTLKIAAASPT